MTQEIERTHSETLWGDVGKVGMQNLEAILSSIKDGFFVLDRHWCYVYTNDRNCELTALSRSDLLGKNIWALFPDLVNTQLYEQFQQSMAEQTALQFEFFYPAWNRWFENRLYPSDQMLTVLVADITDRKQAEITLRRSEERALLAIKVGRLGTWRYDPITKLVEFDRRMCEIWGELDEGVVLPLSTVIERIHPDDQDRVAIAVQQALDPNSNGVYEIDYRIVRKDGTERWILANGQVQFTADLPRQPTGFIGTALDITERKRTENALYQTEERLRVALQNSPITVFSQNRELKYTWIYNPVLYELQEMLGKHDRDFLPPVDAEPLTLLKQQVLETGVGVRQEVKIVRDDNNYYDLTIEPLHDAISHEVVGITCAAIDISNLKRAELAARENEERLRLAMEGAQMGTWDINLVTGEAIWSEQHFEMLGYVPSATSVASELMWLSQIHPDDREWVIQEWQQSRCERRLYRAEYRVIRADNQQTAWLAALGNFVYNAEGQAVRSIGVLFDITDRKHAEAALLAQEQRYRYIFDAVNVSIWEEDFSQVKGAIDQLRATGVQDFHRYFAENPDFVEAAIAQIRLRDINAASLRLFGARSKTELLTSLDRIFVPESQEAFVQELLAIANGEPSFAAETVLQTLQGDRFYVWFTITFPPPSEPYDRVLVSLLDISDRKHAEAERERLLQREQVAREQAEHANRIKDEFLAVLSHELRSPLNPILGWSKLLREGKLDDQTRDRALETIERNAKLQTQLIEDLLDVSRILRGKMGLTVAPLSFVNIVESAIETVRLAAEAKTIELRFNVGEGTEWMTRLVDAPPTPLLPLQVMGDATRLQQIVWNLLSNAVKFTPSGGRVDIRLQQVGNHAQLQVTDTGIGINPDFLPHVFDYFRQEDGKTTRRFGGLGLGLAIVRHLTELHGGSVTADSPGVGLGATFTVKLPLITMGDNPRSHPDNPMQSSSLHPLRVLVVDDEQDMRDLAQIILEQQGAQVEVAASAAEAMTLFEQQPPDVLISDIGMPGMDGYRLMQHIRRRSPEQGGLVLAIALTAYAGELDQREARQVGFQQHLAKPVEPQQLINAIVKLVNHNTR